MKVYLASDIHAEFHMDGGESFVKEIDKSLFDVVVLAGDVGTVANCCLSIFMEKLARQIDGKPVIYVPGNHEYYGTDFQTVANIRKTLPGNVKFLDNETCTIDGVRFIGSTLWFPYQTDSWQYDSFLGDFKYISDFREWNYDRAENSRLFLNNTVQNGDVVVTHHLPDENAIAPSFRNYPYTKYNRYFLHQVPKDTIAKARLWLFGHTHEMRDFQIGDCRLVCNPFGYPRENKSPFLQNFVIEV